MQPTEEIVCRDCGSGEVGSHRRGLCDRCYRRHRARGSHTQFPRIYPDRPTGEHPTPLTERRCTKCGRGILQGARFNRRTGQKTGYRPECKDCVAVRVRALRQRRMAG